MVEVPPVRTMRLVAIIVAINIAIVAVYLTLRPTQLGTNQNAAQAGPQETIPAVGYEELIPYLTATVTTADLLLRCTDPTPTQSNIAAQLHRDTASKLGLVPDDVDWITEYIYSNTADATQGYIPGFGDTVQIVIFQLRKMPEPRPISAVLIYAIDTQTGKIEDLNKDGSGSEYFRPSPGYSTWHCTPVPTPNWTPIPATQEGLPTSTPSSWSGVLSPEENATNEVIMAESRALMKQCFDPTPTPGVLAEKIRRDVAQQEGIPLGSIEVLDEFSFKNPIENGSSVLEGFGDSVYIVVVQRETVPEGFKGVPISIFAIDPATGKTEDVNKPGIGGRFDFGRPNGSSHCTPVPTPNITPRLVMTAELTEMAQTAVPR